MRVRAAVLTDLDRLALLFEGYRRFYQQPADLAQSRAFLAERLTNVDSVVIVAEEGSDLVGFTQLYPLFSSTVCRKPGWFMPARIAR